MGASGAGGAYVYNNRGDLLEAMFRDGSRGLMQGISPAQSSNGDMNQLKGIVSSLASQVDNLASTQRQSHSIIVQSSQPSSVLGVPLWKLVGLVGTAGTIYMKVSGYELKDIVYVSKKHFDTATAALKDQYDQLEIAVAHVKGELLQRMGVVEKKMDETRDSIHLKIDSEMGKVDQRIGSLSKGVGQLDSRMAHAGLRLDSMAHDMASVKLGLNNITSELDARLAPMHRDIEEYHNASTQSHQVLSQEMGSMQTKIDRQSRGIELLVDFAARSAVSSPDLVDALETYKREESNTDGNRIKHTRVQSAHMLTRKPSEGLARVKFVTA